MTYYELKIYINNRRKPLCKALFETKQSLDNFIDYLSEDVEIVKLGDVIFKRKDLHYAEIKERKIK